MNFRLHLRTRVFFLPVLLLFTYCFALAQESIDYRAVLTGRSQSTPVLTSARGEIEIQIANNQLIVSGQFTNLSSDIPAEGINIHTAFAGQSGNAVYGLIPTLNADQRSGRLEPALNTFAISDAQAAAFATRQFYVNIATVEQPDGEIRGQIVPDGLTFFYTNAYGSNETHSVLSRGSASVLVEVVSSDQMVVTGSFNDLEGNISGANLYLGVPGETGTQEVALTPTTSDQQNGTFEVENNTFDIDLDLIIALGERRVYLNLMSDAFPNGELRGQLVPAEAGVVFRTHLSGTNTIPNVLTQATGHLLAEVYGDSLMILSGTYQGLGSALRDDPLSKTGIFEGLAGQNGSKALPLNPTASSPEAGVVEATRNIYLLSDEESELLFQRALNISIASENHPDGEIRGQLVPEAQIFFTGSLSGILQVPPVRTAATGNSIIEFRGSEISISGAFQGLEDDLAQNNGITSGLAGSNGPAQFLINVEGNREAATLAATANTFTLSDAQIDDLLARRLFMNISSGASATPELRAQILPEASAYFLAALSGASQTPAVRSSSLGQTIMEVHPNEVVVSGSFSNLESNFDLLIGAHIHNGLAGQNGGVDNALVPEIADNQRNGSFQAAANAFTLSDEQIASLFARAQYVNIHSQENPSGEIRGQLLPFANGHFTTTLSGFNQVNPLESAGQGGVKFDLLGNTLTVSGSISGLSSSTTDESAMLFAGEAGKAGSLAFPLVMIADNNSGVLQAADNQFMLSEEQIALLRAENMYISVSSNGNMSGEIRGQVLTEPNFFPTGNMRFTQPVDGEFFVAEGDPTALFTARWSEGVDNNQLYYIFQTSEFLDFRSIDEELIVTDAPGEFQYRLSELDSFLMSRGIAVGDTIARYYRMVATDGSLTTIGEGNFIQLVRGEVRPVAGADIELFLDGPTGPYEIFTEIPYTITVVNNGPLNARDILVDLPQPEGMVYTRSSATQGRYNLFFENWEVDNLAAGDTAVMDLTLFTLVDEAPIDFFIEVQGSLPADPDSRPFNGVSPMPMEDDEAVFTIFPEPRPMGGDTSDLRLNIRPLQEEFQVFSDASFELIVTNDGPDAAANIRVSALFPEGTVFTGAEATQGEYSVVNQDWYIPMMESGASDTLRLTLFALIEGQPLILFSQIIASDQFDPDSTPANDLDNVPDEDDEARAVVFPRDGIQGGTESDLELTLEIDRPEYERFVNYTYTFTLTNNGPDDASNILIDAQLPDSLAYTSKAASIGDWNNFFQNWTIPYLRSGEQHTLKLVLFTLAKEEPITYFTQILRVDQNDPDSAPANNQTGIPAEDDEASVTLTPVSPERNINTFARKPSVEGILYPSPASNTINLNLHSEEVQNVELQLMSIDGRVLKQIKTSLEAGLNQLEYDITRLPDGIYYVGLIDNTLQRQTWKFVKVSE